MVASFSITFMAKLELVFVLTFKYAFFKEFSFYNKANTERQKEHRF